ncbi:MvdC/MvdD family ATP grasp protein [Streptomyces sp. NBC_00878]|uniref:MvdC/MvdD family ATP grasp protein n=1 Tax=Streptomyces sp. NBC_00878 TaxID=2975854 RepID=UPI002B1DABA5|nr:hypothetical protein [Streptomyces sp. NBC_00878]
MSSPVLVVTQLDDATADGVIEELNRRSVPVVRLDPGDFPAAVVVDARVGDVGLVGGLRTATRAADLDQVRSVYWRRPSPYSAPEGVGAQDARWCVDQARYGLGGLLAALPGAHYVNHPWRNRDAEYKPAQLAAAARSGLHVPPTLLTNDRERAASSLASTGPSSTSRCATPTTPTTTGTGSPCGSRRWSPTPSGPASRRPCTSSSSA